MPQVMIMPTFDEYAMKDAVKRQFGYNGDDYHKRGMFTEQQLEIICEILNKAFNLYSNNLRYSLEQAFQQNKMTPEDVHSLFIDALMKNQKD